ncbi:MAG: GDSL-type esterase/lipase family protein, partial [Nitrospirota bacterium]|nr:GDSL-type esterase/lipase family protein [Nitrospirota bacterium]
LYIKLFLLTCSIGFSLLIGEIIVRQIIPQQQIRLHLPMTMWDPYVGYVNIPNFDAFSETEEYHVKVKINSHGLRDRDFDYTKPVNTIRIGIFGDSMTFGWGVEAEETYSKVLEDLLSRDKTVQKIEVINFGISNTGTSHQLALYQKEGRKYNLDFVIVGFYPFNDFDDNWRGVFCLKDDILAHKPIKKDFIRTSQQIIYSILPVYSYLAHHSYLVNLIRSKAVSLYWKKQEEAANRLQNEPTINIERKGIESDTYLNSKKSYLTYKLIEKFQEETRRNNSYFMLINIPAIGQKDISEYSEKDEIPEYVTQFHGLLKELNKQNINMIDVTSILSPQNNHLYYFKQDTHINNLGHRLIADNIYKTISPFLLKEKKEVEEKRTDMFF